MSVSWLPDFLYYFICFIALICFADSYINVKIVVRILKYSGASTDDEYMYQQLLKAEKDINYTIKNEKGGYMIQIAIAEKIQKDKVLRA